MAQWNRVPLIDYIELIGGGTPKTTVPEYWNGNIPWLSVKDFNNDKRYVYSTEKHISQSGFENSPTKMLHKDDIIISARGTVGEIAMIPFDMAFNQSCYGIRASRGIDQPFLYYLLKNCISQLKRMTHGSVFDTITRDTFANIEVDIPDAETQKRISSVLADIDNKIEVNDAINDNLQQQAAALFSSLYDRTNTEVRFTDLIQILGGGTPKTGENTYWNGNIAFFTPKDVGTPYTLITEKTITEEGLSHCNSRLYPVNTVFVTARGTVGKVGMSGVPMAMNQSCYALVGKETHQLLVYFYTLKAVDRLKHKASGAVFDAITTRDFESEQIMKLSDDDAKAFLCIAEPMFQKVLNNCIENLRLSTLRDSLLPKLMSGEVDVSAVQL